MKAIAVLVLLALSMSLTGCAGIPIVSIGVCVLHPSDCN